MNRREWLSAMACGSLLLPVSLNSWAVRGTQPSAHRLVVLLLRGAVDGLSVVTPYTESAYHQLRGSIALAEPRKKNGVLALDQQFGLHPALSMLMPYWQNNSMAFVHATGSPDPTRSHFDAQTFMETAKGGRQKSSDGWMNRLLAELINQHPDQTALSAGNTIPKIMQGVAPVTPFDFGKGAQRKTALDHRKTVKWFDQLYGDNGDIANAYQASVERRRQILADLSQQSEGQLPNMKAEQMVANQGAPTPVGFALEAQQIATILKQDVNIPLVFADLGDWDTHVNQGGATSGRLSKNLKSLGLGLNILIQSLGDLYADTTIVVMSEFGRTVAQNGTGGTDHGHGNVMWLFGGGVNGGKVHTDWPTLDRKGLYEARDLAVTTDYRAVLQQILAQRYGLSDAALQRVFPQSFATNRVAKSALKPS
jgi:uncharacterized protein (DUF1501 family)